MLKNTNLLFPLIPKFLEIRYLIDDACCVLQQASVGKILKLRTLSVISRREAVGREAAKFVFYLEKTVVFCYSFGAA